jgi:hypothetical protein
MSACYSCHAILNKKNQSFEHIIPNAIGGVLKSARLICKECNSAYGMTIDAALAKDFENLAAFLNIGRDRPKTQIIKNTVAPNGDLYHLEDGYIPVPVKPTIRFDKDQLYISGRDKKQVMQIASGLKRKFPDIDLESIEKNFREEDVLVDYDLTINFSVGSDLFMRSVAKIAVNYYLMKVRGRQYLDKIINVINGVEVNQDQIRYYPLRADIWDDDEASHLIMIKGNNASNKLQAHVVLFNTYSLVINLCDDYDGGDVDFFYRYDVLRRQEIKARIDLGDDRNEFLMNEQAEKWKELLISSVQHNLGRILQIAQRQHTKLSLTTVIDRTFDNAISGYPSGTRITQQIANDVREQVLAAVNDFTKRNS